MTTDQQHKGFQDLKAIAFDVQGTCVDFYQPLLRAGAELNRTKGLSIEWAEFSAEWRDLYRNAMDAVIEGRRVWLRVDRIYREALDVLLERRGFGSSFTESDRDELNAVWTRLDPWPDSIAGLTRLRRHYTTATLSNAGMAAVVAVVKHAGLSFDAILTAELVKTYKPAPAVYQLAVDFLGYLPHQILMVACHKYDLRAARRFGMRTAFVARPLEFGPHARPDIAPESWFDICADDLTSLANKLGASS
ncbi:haloacid dehalogenase type II [Bradyrhizobium sp. UFLA05-109]